VFPCAPKGFVNAKHPKYPSACGQACFDIDQLWFTRRKCGLRDRA
jgi:hypothetical protein